MGLSWTDTDVMTDRGSRWACHGSDTDVMTDRGSIWVCHGADTDVSGQTEVDRPC